MGVKSQPMLQTFYRKDPLRHRWGVILAGGEGKRLLPLTRRITGDDRPKQFCPIIGGKTLLDQTQSRVSRMVLAQQTLLVVTESHERFYARQASVSHPSLLLVQPHNRGTAPAILYSLLRLRELDPNAVVGFFPSDHYFVDDEAFVRTIDTAFETVELRPGLMMLLGIEPNGPEVEYGWIEPGPPLAHSSPDESVFCVKRFWEKPSFALATDLMGRGCLWNSFIMVGRVDSFLKLIGRALPHLLQSFESIGSTFFTARERGSLLDLYSGIPSSSFSEEVLSAYPSELAVLSSANLGWSDLGEAGRVLSVLRCKGIRPEWEPDPLEERRLAAAR